jgi:hypothetical protein
MTDVATGRKIKALMAAFDRIAKAAASFDIISHTS